MLSPRRVCRPRKIAPSLAMIIDAHDGAHVLVHKANPLGDACGFPNLRGAHDPHDLTDLSYWHVWEFFGGPGVAMNLGWESRRRLPTFFGTALLSTENPLVTFIIAWGHRMPQHGVRAQNFRPPEDCAIGVRRNAPAAYHALHFWFFRLLCGSGIRCRVLHCAGYAPNVGCNERSELHRTSEHPQIHAEGAIR